MISSMALAASVAALFAGTALLSASLQSIGRSLRVLRAPTRRFGDLRPGYVRISGRLVPAGKKGKAGARSIGGSACLARRLWVRDPSRTSLGPPYEGEAPFCEDLFEIDLIDDDGARVRVDVESLPWAGLPVSHRTILRDALVSEHPAIAAGLAAGATGSFDVYEVVIPSGGPALIQGRARKGPLPLVEVVGASEGAEVSGPYRDAADGWMIDAEVEPNDEAVIQFGSAVRGVIGRVTAAVFALFLGAAVLAHTAAYLAIRWYERLLSL
jgi:hypothetical protein